jgi:hypothetical protein
MLFGGYSTKDQASNDKHDFIIKPGVIASNDTTDVIGPVIESTKEKNPWDIAVYAHQVLWQAEGNPQRKVTILTGGTAGPDDPQFAQYNVFAGVEGYGLIESRPHDRMGVSAWKNWLHLTPDLQFLQNEHKGDNLAVVPGVRLVVDF